MLLLIILYCLVIALALVTIIPSPPVTGKLIMIAVYIIVLLVFWQLVTAPHG